MNFQTIDPVVGSNQANFVTVVDTTQRMKTGSVVTAIDNYWGYAEFIYGKAAGTIQMGGVSTIASVLVSGALETQMTVATKTASYAGPYCIAMAGMTVGQFGWFALSGSVPVAGTGLVAGNSASLSATPGQLTTALATFGVQGLTVSLAPATTSAKTGCSGVSGQLTIQVPNAEGWFQGCVLTGTGIGASSLVSKVSPDGRTVTVTVANSAAVTGTVTATYTGFVIATISRPAGLGL